MSFKGFQTAMKTQTDAMLKQQKHLFFVDSDKDTLWELYLDSFPEGTNEVFRERREYDCCACRQFIRAFGNVVVIKDSIISSIWDLKTDNPTYQIVADALSRYIKTQPVGGVFIPKEALFGVVYNFEQGKGENQEVVRWEHFHYKLPSSFVYSTARSVGDIQGEFRDSKNVFKRSLNEITPDSLKTVLELITQKSLYKGEEWEAQLKKLKKVQKEYIANPLGLRDNWCWTTSMEIGPALSRIRNHSIGTLLTNISKGMDLDTAVKKYEEIVAPINYKHPKAIFTESMRKAAEKTLTDEGLIDSLERRFAVPDDITINNVLFGDKDSGVTTTSIFESLKQDTVTKEKTFAKVEQISAELFVKDILPTVTSIKAYFKGSQIPNLFSLIAPKNSDSKNLFKWDNNFSWAYKDNVTDSMKERVKALGGSVTGVLRFTLQWNEGGGDNNDLDAHCVEPNRNRIYYNRPSSISGGRLDVDIQEPVRQLRNETAVENITWANTSKMLEGNYEFLVHNYKYRGGDKGFRAELEFDGQIHSFSYNRKIGDEEKVFVVTVNYNKEKGFTIVKSLNSTLSNKVVWGLKTNEFIPVSMVMYSPNYWNEQLGIGHRHYFFVMKGGVNDETPNGFFNEFLPEDLMKHKKILEALGSRMKVEASEKQLTGLGFSSTKRGSLICQVEGTFTRTLEVIF